MKRTTNDFKFLIGLLFVAAIIVGGRAINRVVTGDTFPGIKHTKNYVLNPDFEQLNVLDWTSSSGTFSLATSQAAADRLNGAAWGSWSPGALNATLKGGLRAVDQGILRGAENCQAEVRYNFGSQGSAGAQGYELYFEDSTTANVSGTAVLQATYDALAGTTPVPRSAILFFPCNKMSGGKITYKYVSTSASDITIDDITVGPAWSIGAGVPPNTFTAKVSATGVVTDETGGDWISGNCTNASPRVCTLVSPTSSTMNCLFNASSGPRPPAVLSTNTVLNINTYDLTGSPSQVDGQITCTKTGSDYIQPAITPNQWNFPYRSYATGASTPAMTAASGTLTNYVYDYLEYRRQGPAMFIRAKIRFTGAVGTWTNPRVPLPPNITLLGSSALRLPGVSLEDSGTNVHAAYVRPISTSLQVTQQFGADAGAEDVRQGVPFGWTSGDFIEFETPALMVAENGVPWTENQGAPQLVGSVTSNSSNALRVVSFTFNKSGGVCNSSPCDVTSSTDPITVTRSGTGVYPTNVKNYFNGPSQCFANNLGVTNNKCLINSVGTVYCTVTSTGGVSDDAVDVFCIGPR